MPKATSCLFASPVTIRFISNLATGILENKKTPAIKQVLIQGLIVFVEGTTTTEICKIIVGIKFVTITSDFVSKVTEFSIKVVSLIPRKLAEVKRMPGQQ